MRSVAVATLFVLVTVACAADDAAAPVPPSNTTSTSTSSTTTSTTAAPTTTTSPPSTTTLPANLEGEIFVSGATDVFPILQFAAEQFSEEHPGVLISVDGPGSDDGAALICGGVIPIVNASEPFTPEQLDVCDDAGILLIELPIASQVAALVTTLDAGTVDCLSFNQLYALWSEEAQGFDRWSDANALLEDMGSEADRFPDLPLELFGYGELEDVHRLYSSVVAPAVIDGRTGLDPDRAAFTDSSRPDYIASTTDWLVDALSETRTGLAFLDYDAAAVATAEELVRYVAVSEQDDGPCVSPTPETVASAAYPLHRELFTYVNAGWAGRDPAVAAFMDWVTGPPGRQTVAELTGTFGIVPLDETGWAATRDRWERRTVVTAG